MARKFAKPASTLQFQRLPAIQQTALRKFAESSNQNQRVLRDAVVRNRGFTNLIPTFAALPSKPLGRPQKQLFSPMRVKLGKPPLIDPFPLQKTVVGNDRLSFTGRTNTNFPNRLKNIEIGEAEKIKSTSTLFLIIAAMVLFFTLKK